MTNPFGRPTSTRRHVARGALGGWGIISREIAALSLSAAAGVYALTGTAATLKLARKLVAAAGSFALTGTDAVLTKGGKILTAGAGSFALTGTAAALMLSRKIVADAGAFALTGQTANLNKGQRLVAASGSYALTGTAATLTLTTSRTFTFVGSVTSSASTINISGTGLQSGDFGVLLDYATDGGGAPSAATPSGHTQAATSAGTFARVSITYKVLTGSEGSLTGMNGGGHNRKIYLVFRPSSAISTVTYTAGGAEVTGGNPTSKTSDPSAETTAAIIVGEMASNGAISPRTTSPAMDEVAGSSTAHYAHYKIYNTSPASQSYDMDDEGNDNGIIVGYFTFT